MNGRSSTQQGNTGIISKWTDVHRTVRQKQIGILCLQETHLEQNHIDTIHNLFGRRIEVHNSAYPNNPSGSAGVAFVINKEKLKTDHVETLEIIPGRAMLLTVKWHNENKLRILNTYAPNAQNTHQNFWTEIRRRLTDLNVGNIDILLGDFNIIEDMIDRSPARNDDFAGVEALKTFREAYQLRDQWRHDNPNTRSFTFTSNTHSMSRLDRIYANRALEKSLYNWETTDTQIYSDHKMVLTRLIPPRTPYIGAGRWTLPLSLTTNEELMNEITKIGIDLQKELRTQNEQPTAPQVLWTAFKYDVTKLAKRLGKIQLAKMTKKIETLKKDIVTLEQSPDLDTTQDQRTNLALLQHELQHIEQKRNKNARAKAQAQWQEKGEKINKYWMKTNNPRRPRDIIYSLFNPTKDGLTSKSSEMAEIAQKYHNELQSANILDPEDPERQNAQADVLAQIPESQKFNDPNSDLHNLITEEQVINALNASKNGTATGLDGLPYELWKALHDRHLKLKKLQKPSFNVIECLTVIYNNIQTFGTDPTANFSIGWMCPLYKKKDRTKIENYRPITLLNTDYKIMTKALATQLAKHACSLIHPDQTGFIPTRSIFDPIRLAETMCAYADYMEEDGAIVALDQEKAYDKIDHKYLITTLKTFRLPERFVKTVETLYKNAYTGVMINGVLSKTYQVTRGVRQGDPLSCLLFDLAIEPLAASIRNSAELEGFSIPNQETKIIVNLYADDTTVYLSSSDKYSTLEEILTKWCRASGAKFNLEKTEIIPIGTRRHRERVVETRKLHPNEPSLANGIRIAKDGQQTRILGAWIGNDIEQAHPWTTVTDKIKDTLDKWAMAKPTLDAKRLLIQMVVGGMTQFLTKAQGMPRTVLKTIIRYVREFLWDGSQTPPGMGLEQLMKPRNKGGIDLINLEMRNQAIELTWLKTYLNLSGPRPTWAFVVDTIINCVQKNGITNPKEINTFLTTLRPSGRNRRDGKQIPRPVVTLIQTAKKHNLTFAPQKLSKALKRKLPAWHHIGAPPNQYHKGKSACLRNNHKAVYVKDLVKISRRVNRHDTKHMPLTTCQCRHCRADRTIGCQNPHKCATVAKNIIGVLPEKYDPYDGPPKDHLTLTHRRKEKNQSARVDKGDEITFDPTITARGTLDECFRVMARNTTTPLEPARRIQTPRLEQGQRIDPLTVYTDGSCLRNGKLDATCGGGVWFGDDHPLNKAIRVPGTQQSNQTGEIAAITVALQLVDPTIPITIITDSRYAMDGLTVHLKSWEDKGWTNVSNHDWFEAAAYQLRRRAAPTNFKWTKGHAGTDGNEQADRLADQGARKDIPDDINLSVPENFKADGIRLSTLTQKTAYKALNESKQPPYTRQTLMNLDITRYAIKDMTKATETDETIWTKIRNADIRRPIQTFLYRAMTGSLRIGEFWEKIPNLENRAKCPQCNDYTESLEHIQTECSNPERKLIWELTKKLWPEANDDWDPPTIGQILGCGCIAPTHNEENKPTAKERGEARLKRILTSESAHLIWVLRCEKVIGGTQHTANATRTRWLNKITSRLDIDRRLAKSKRIPAYTNKVINTWTNILQIPNSQSHDWATNLEVLVGINLSRSPADTGDTG